jgi:hypothetical protein
MKRNVSILTLACGVLSVGMLVQAPAMAGIVATHTGDVDPTTIGWTLTDGGSSTVQAITNDGGVDAWRASSSGAGNFAFYKQNAPADSDADLQAGWKLSVNAKINGTSDPANIGLDVMFNTSTTRYSMLFGASASGNALVGLKTTASLSALPADTHEVASSAGTYNLYELLDATGSGTAELFVNGVTTGLSFSGEARPNASVVWWGNTGALSDGGDANFAFVEFETGAGLTPSGGPIPEPASLTLLAAGGLFLLPKRKRNQ